MAFFRLQWNCNGTFTIRLIAMVFLRIARIVMAPDQLTLCKKVFEKKANEGVGEAMPNMT
jgi:hypothetical protein